MSAVAAIATTKSLAAALTKVFQALHGYLPSLRQSAVALCTCSFGGALFVRTLFEKLYTSIKALPPTAKQLKEEDLAANPLYRLIPELRGKFAWRQLGDFPTPVHQFSCRLPNSDAEVQFWVKREDLSSPLYGGNKVRTLQYQLAACEAHFERCADNSVETPTFVVLGSGGSNQNIATKAHAAAINLPASSICAVTPVPDEKEMDNTLNYLSSLSLPGSQGQYGKGMGKVISAAFGSGSSWVFNAGGNGPLGVLGQVGALVELAEQIVAGNAPDPDGIVVALGSSCTVTGLIMGVALVRKMGLPAFCRPGFRIFAQPVHPAFIHMQRAFKLLESESMPFIGRGLREVAAIIHSAGGPDVSAAALRIMREELTISLDLSIAGKYGAHSDVSRKAKAMYDSSVTAAAGLPDLWLCGHFTAKSFALLLKLLGEKETSKNNFIFWQTKSAIQPLGPEDEWAAWEEQCRSSGACAKWGVVGGSDCTGHPLGKGTSEAEHKIIGPDEYRPFMTPVLRTVSKM